MLELREDDDYPKLKLHLKGHKKRVTGISFHPNGIELVSCSEDNLIVLWDLEQKRRAYTFKEHLASVSGVEFFPNGQFFASCSVDGKVWIQEPKLKGNSCEFCAHRSGAVNTLAISSSNTELLTGSDDKTIKLWKFPKRQLITTFSHHTGSIRNLQFSPDGTTFASCSDDQTVKIWDTKSRSLIHSFNIGKGRPTCLSFHPSGDFLAIAKDTGSVRIYHIGMRSVQQHYTLHDNTINVSWHQSGSFFLTCGRDGKIKIVDALRGKPIYTITDDEPVVSYVRFNADGDLFASGQIGGHIKVWEKQLT